MNAEMEIKVDRDLKIKTEADRGRHAEMDTQGALCHILPLPQE